MKPTGKLENQLVTECNQLKMHLLLRASFIINKTYQAKEKCYWPPTHATVATFLTHENHYLGLA